jgi:hypothetical protein
LSELKNTSQITKYKFAVYFFGLAQHIVEVATHELLLETGVKILPSGGYRKQNAEQLQELKVIGIVDDENAIAYIHKIERQIEAWEPIKAAFDKETKERLETLQEDFRNQYS